MSDSTRDTALQNIALQLGLIAANGPDFNTEWVATAPAVGAGSGTITSASAAVRYKQLGKTIFLNAIITITTNGSGGSYVTFGVPVIAKTFNTPIAGREDGVTGKALTGVIQGATGIIWFYDSTYPGANGAILDMAGVYEAA